MDLSVFCSFQETQILKAKSRFKIKWTFTGLAKIFLSACLENPPVTSLTVLFPLQQ